MKIYIIRGAFLNPFELQNYYPLRAKHKIIAISSKFPISSQIELPLKKLWSPTDLPNFPYKYPILSRLFTDAHKLFGLEKTIKNADIVHVAETYYGYTRQAIKFKIEGKVDKIVSTVWEVIPFNNEGIAGRKNYKKLAQLFIDHFIAVTYKAKNALVKEGFKPSRISVIRAGLDLKKFFPKKDKRNKRDLNILCVARLVPEKGVEDLLSAFLEIAKTNNNIHLTFIGDGPLKFDLSGFKNVYVKKVPYSKMPSVYNHADIFCLPSRSTKTWAEQYGMCLVEAMACGLPIVTTKTGAIDEVCEDAAVYAKQGDPDSLKTKLEELIYNVELRHKLGKIGRKRAIEYFDRDKISAQIEDLYKQICRSKRP